MKDSLLELLKGFRTPICEGINAKLPNVEGLADYLITNGVIVPPFPVKVRDKVYRIVCRVKDFFIREETVWIIDVHANAGFEVITKYVDKKGCTYFPKIETEDIGISIFLTREEAERALKGAKE